MNGLTLRINGAAGGKSTKSIGFSPVHIISSSFEDSDYLGGNEMFKKFADSDSTDEQLAIIKNILDESKDVVDCNIIKFMVAVFLQAEAKHPVKCFILRQVTKNAILQGPFTEALALQITSHLVPVSHYKQYVDVVSKVAMCIENFDAGVAAVKLVETNLGTYLKDCLQYCVLILSENKTSPTEKNEIFNLSHLSLRLLLHIIEKANKDSHAKLTLMFSEIRLCIEALMFDDDAPMDTKSVCGILYLSMHIIENGDRSWVDILDPTRCNASLGKLLEAEASQLCLYSAIVTVVPIEELETETIDGGPAVIQLMSNIIAIGERNSSESTFVLGVARTVVQLSKSVDKIRDRDTGLRVLESLLQFTWSHLEHHVDSVRHLTAQLLAHLVDYCAAREREGDGTALSQLLTAVESLSRARKSYYVSVSCLAHSLGSRVTREFPRLVHDALRALTVQHVQATATTALSALLQQHASCSTEQLHSVWVRAVLLLLQERPLDAPVLNVLENLLVKAVRMDQRLMDYIIPYIKQYSEDSSGPRHLTCVLMLLSVTRKCGAGSQVQCSDDDSWKGIISYDLLKRAAIDAVDETRILSLSLIVESPKSTEEFTAGDLNFVLWFLKYNINAQAPNFRQLTLSAMKKFIKRFEDSYKVIKRQKQPNVSDDKVQYYLRFVESFRSQCFDSLIPGANYGRRSVALQLLVWEGGMVLEGGNRVWNSEYVEKLLLHLEDSYENNKGYALQVLEGCPVDLVKNNKYTISLDLKDILAQASSLKPTDCTSAAYKLDYLRKRLPEYILQNEPCSAASPVTYRLVEKLLHQLAAELSACSRSVVLAARQAPMYGLVHCITHVLQDVDPQAISSDPQWRTLISELISTCMSVNQGVSSVVNNSSPEGHLPMDMTGVLVTDHGNSGGVVLDDGRQVTSQMVLLCAWRSVKEVSLLLGLISSRLTISGEDSEMGTLSLEQVRHIGDHFTTLLAETKHRGAFEQAYVGFTHLLARLWRSVCPALHSLPKTWLQELTSSIASGDNVDQLCATRRSAGLPFMIQALVTTELQVHGNPRSFHSCMSSLLSVAGSSPCELARAHALNILRALYRHAALHDSVAHHVGEGLMRALAGFERGTWAERNSSTLLFAALMVRVFGVARARDELSARNTMTGRIFFLRYPQLYDFMLEKLQEVSSTTESPALRPSLYPVLWLLARLYPSSLEGTVSNLKLESFIPYVVSCAGSPVLTTRQLAARAVLPLIAPQRFVSHVESMFALLTRHTPRNYCHGVLLQLTLLLTDDNNPNCTFSNNVNSTFNNNNNCDFSNNSNSSFSSNRFSNFSNNIGFNFINNANCTLSNNISCHVSNNSNTTFSNNNNSNFNNNKNNTTFSNNNNSNFNNNSTCTFSNNTNCTFSNQSNKSFSNQTNKIITNSDDSDSSNSTNSGPDPLHDTLKEGVYNTLWLLEQALQGTQSCFLIADEYIKLLNIVVWRFVSHVESMFALLTRHTPRNYCHGVLLQLTLLLTDDNNPNCTFSNNVNSTFNNNSDSDFNNNSNSSFSSNRFSHFNNNSGCHVSNNSHSTFNNNVSSNFNNNSNCVFSNNTNCTFSNQSNKTYNNETNKIITNSDDSDSRNSTNSGPDPLHDTLKEGVYNTLWLLEQALQGTQSCFLIADEYIKLLNIVVWRFPSLLSEEVVSKIVSGLNSLMINSKSKVSPGREVCLSNAIYLYFILINKKTQECCNLVVKALQHPVYEVVLSTLNYLLVLHDKYDETKCKFLEHLTCTANRNVLDTLKQTNSYINLLCQVSKHNYFECKQKSLKILTLEGDTQRFIVEGISDDSVISRLFDCVRNEHEKLTHIYLESLLNFVTKKLKDSSIDGRMMLEVMQVVLEYSSADNSERVRGAVVSFIETNVRRLIDFDVNELTESKQFEFQATVWCTIITLLEDDELPLRQRCADAVTSQCSVTSLAGVTSRVFPGACCERVRARVECERDSDALFVLIALADFKSVVVSDDGNDECRVFDQNERYNIYLEETVWTSECAEKIISSYNSTTVKILDYVSSLLDHPRYKETFDKLCNDNVVLFKRLISGDKMSRNDALNPKIELLFNKLSSFSELQIIIEYLGM